MLNVLDADVEVLVKTLDLKDCFISRVVLCWLPAALVDLFQDLQVSLDPWVLDLEDDGLFALLHDPACEGND